MAVQKVLIGNCITSIRAIKKINFLQIFERINGVEEILKKDPVQVYEKMDYRTKDYYRNKIKKLSKKTKLSEIYISQKILELAQNNYEKNGYEKKSHIGYYVIDGGIDLLYDKLDKSG